MKIVFMGTPQFAVPSLDILVKNNYDIVGVVTTPDKPSGRGLKVNSSEIKKFAVEKGLKVLQPEKMNNPEFVQALKELKPDLQIVVAFKKLPESVWSIPSLGTFNLHASVLPDYRGAAPINHAIINGETETGITTFFINNEIDAGKILFVEKTKIEYCDTAGTIHDRLMLMGADLVLKTVRAIESKEAIAREQDEILIQKKVLKIAPKIFKENCKINWNQPVDAVYNFIRGLSPYPGAWCHIASSEENKMMLKIISVSIDKSIKIEDSGVVFSDEKSYIKISALGGCLSVNELQIEGRKALKTEDFLRGHKISDKKIV